MSAKSKSSDKSNNSNPYLEPNKDPELEKKVDELLSVEEPDPVPQPPSAPEAPEESSPSRIIVPITDDSTEVTDTPPVAPVAETPATSSAPELSSAPLLPTDKLPDLNKKKQIAVVSHDELETDIESTTPDKSTVPVEPETPVVPDEPLEAFEPPPPSEPTEPAEPEPVPETEEPTLAPEEPEPQPLPKPVALKPQQPADELGLEDPSTDRAIDEIIASDADELLAARDHSVAAQQAPLVAAPKRKKRIPKFVIIVLLFLILLGAGAAAAVPESRYMALNTAGVKSASSVTVLDETTGQPLKNAEFTIAGTSAKTDSEGNARVEQIKLGDTTMTIKKPAFAEFSQPVTVGWGSNPLGEFRIKAVGTQYKFVITDFLSKKPIPKAEATSGQANARANDKGEIVLTLPQSEADAIKIQISADSYRSETIDANTDTKDARTITLTPARKHVFISKRAGTFDVYKIDVDAKNEEKVLSGTGKERSETIALSAHPSKNIAALVSNRDAGSPGKESPSKLTLINIDDNTTTVATTSERVQLVDWIGNKLIYVKVAENQPVDSPNRHRLVSYDIDSKNEREIASANYFNDVVIVNDSIYYSPAMYQINGAVGLFKVNAEGNVKKTVYDKEVWNLFRTAYDKLSVSLGQEWLDLNVTTDAVTKAAGPPPMLKSRVYFDNPDNTASLWIDERDGKGVMLSYDHTKKEDSILLSQSGLKNPVRWIDNKHIIYRVNNSQETADYIFNTDGGQSQKIRDVTDTAGIDRWYYY